MPDGAKKILIVEDEYSLSRALELKLGKEGYNVKIAADGGVAVEMLTAESFDLMILDLVMPRYDGFHVLEYVHNNALPLKVIVLSNLSQSEDIKKAKDFGVIEYFVKSNTPISVLVENVELALS